MSEMTPTEAAALVERDREHRAQQAHDAIQQALADWRCELVAMPQIAPDGRLIAVAQIVAR